jgi:hypothetical protein
MQIVTAGIIIPEMVSVETAQPFPCTEPHKSPGVLVQGKYIVIGQPVFYSVGFAYKGGRLSIDKRKAAEPPYKQTGNKTTLYAVAGMPG